MPGAIVVDDLHVRYRNKRGRSVEAVQGLSFAVEPGEVVGFLGPNGAGKSSTLKALMGFVEPYQGSATILGMPAGSIAARRRIGYLPEVAMYYPHLTPLETLHLYGDLQGLEPKQLKRESLELLDFVGLSASKSTRNGQLSKGMLQRVGIAQALLGSPELLILDEVTSGLDPLGRQELRGILKERQYRGSTLFFSSHELSEVEMLCDRILVINQGRLIETRNMKELLTQIGDFSLTYRGAVSLVDLADRWEPLDESRFWAHFASQEHLLAAISRVISEGQTIEKVTAQDGSLEDYFIDTIRGAA